MIKVKASKAPQGTHGPSRETFETKEPGKIWHLPVVVMALMSSVVLYVKSLAGSSAVAAPPEPEKRPAGAAAEVETQAQPIRTAQAEELTEIAGEEKGPAQHADVVPLALRPTWADRTLGSSVQVVPEQTDNVYRLPVRTSDAGQTNGPRFGDDRIPRVSVPEPDAGLSQVSARIGGGGTSGGAGGSSGQKPADDADAGGGGTGSNNGSGSGGTGSNNGSGGGPTGPQRNRAPVVTGAVVLPDLAACQSFFIPFAALLVFARDPDGDLLTVRAVTASSGTLTPVAGGVEFTPPETLRGPVTLTFEVTDGAETVMGAATFNVVEPPPIIGTPDDDVIAGTDADDVIEAREGNDNVDARGGDDVVFGGQGDDHIVAGDGNDVIYAGAGNDLIFGGDGNDVIYGGDGNDRIYGEAGNDVLFGEGGNDTISGGDGHDVIEGGDGNDVLAGDAGNDILSGDAGSDVVDGGMGDDLIVGTLDGAADTYDGGHGHDTLDYSAAMQAVVIDLVRGEASGEEIGVDEISGFEHVVGGQGDDRFIVASEAVVLTGGDGLDTFEFEAFAAVIDNPQVVHEILDLDVGDKIVMRGFHIRKYENEDDSERDEDMSRDRFEQHYGGDDDDRRPFRFRVERVDDKDHTFIDVGHEEDCDTIVFSVDVHGSHRLYAVEIS